MDVERRLGTSLPRQHSGYAWLLRHGAWLLNRLQVGRDGYIPFQRERRRAYQSEICDIFESVLWKVLRADEGKPAERFAIGLWVGKTSRGDDHLIFDCDEDQEVADRQAPT